MTHYSKINIIYRLQKWMDSVPGQTFLNYAYSWGASIVILGTLFKLTHVPGANTWLFLGMGTEVVVFFLSAFDRPFDKTEIGRDLAIHPGQEPETIKEEQPKEGKEPGEENTFADKTTAATQTPVTGGTAAVIGGGIGGGTIIFGGGKTSGERVSENAELSANQPSPDKGVDQSAVPEATIIGSPAWIAAQQGISPEMEEAQNGYIEELKKLTDMLSKVSEQSERLTRDSEEMENLNRTLTGICKIYELQLKGASQQVGTIDQINEQTRRMAQQIEQLNKIYARMIEAMTVNMKTAASGGVNANTDNAV